MAIAAHRAVDHQQRTLWIGAHPDDEALVAPLLAFSGNAAILVFTRGERGTCALPGGCGSDLGAIRTAEMANAAALLNAHLTQWSFSDAGGDVEATWNAEAGGHEALIGRIAALIAAEHPSIIYTFDPNHGSTCHPAHRAVGNLVIEAAARSGTRTFFVETKVDTPDGQFVFRPATPEATAFDVSGGWNWLIADVEVHASQFTPGQVDGLRHTPAAQRWIWLSNAPAQTDSCGR